MTFERIMFSPVTYTKKKYTKTKNGFSKDYLEPHFCNFCVGQNTTYFFNKILHVCRNHLRVYVNKNSDFF